MNEKISLKATSRVFSTSLSWALLKRTGFCTRFFCRKNKKELKYKPVLSLAKGSIFNADCDTN